MYNKITEEVLETSSMAKDSFKKWLKSMPTEYIKLSDKGKLVELAFYIGYMNSSIESVNKGLDCPSCRADKVNEGRGCFMCFKCGWRNEL
jgi:hypothetical protein